MHARVARFEGGTADEMRRGVAAISHQAGQGPPEGVPAVGFLLLVDPEGGRGLAISLFDTEEDMRTGDATLNEMSPPAGTMGRRTSVEFYEVGADFRA
jgi:hypothetical protein